MKLGKIIIFVAPSGGGKSTLIKMLMKDFSELSFVVIINKLLFNIYRK